MSRSNKIIIGQRLREERERLGFTQPQLASRMVTTRQTLIGYERGYVEPRAGYLLKGAAAGMDVLYILTGQRAGSVKEESDQETLTEIERQVLMRYRETSFAIKKIVLRVLNIEENFLGDEPPVRRRARGQHRE